MKKYSVIINGKEINLSKIEFDRFINSKSDKEFLQDCKRVYNNFNKVR